jgi:hypothetical protein
MLSSTSLEIKTINIEIWNNNIRKEKNTADKSWHRNIRKLREIKIIEQLVIINHVIYLLS